MVSCNKDIKNGPNLEKKIIEYGWDVPTSAEVRANIKSMEHRPFDGVIFRLTLCNTPLVPTRFEESAFAQDFEDVSSIAWGTFTDNFVIMWAASNQDWFDDSQWEIIANNARLVAKAARLGKCVGVCFDPEPYGDNPWSYADAARHAEKTFAEYQAMAKARGKQFIDAIEDEFPNPRVLTFFMMSLFSDWCKPITDAEREAVMAESPYALYPAFLNGMLKGANLETAIIDGNEASYGYGSAESFYAGFHLMSQGALRLVDSDLRRKYHAQVQAGQALYIDENYGLWDSGKSSNGIPSKSFAPKQGPNSFMENVYWAMQTSDRYVWCYSENMNWWTGVNIPDGCEDSIRNAKALIQNGTSPGE
jgi:hypothetical protein